MALSGTLDTFALPDVFRLLASTGKTGRLRVTGDRGSGSVWFDGGKLVATEVTGPGGADDGPVEAVFSLLRFAAGSFTFENDARAPHAGTPAEMEPVLAEAENLLVEWRSIVAVVPSLDAWVTLRPALGGADVMVDAARWSVIAAVGSGRTIGEVAAALELGELAVCRVVKELVELGLVEVGERPADLFAPAPAPGTGEPAFGGDAGPVTMPGGVDPSVGSDPADAGPVPDADFAGLGVAGADVGAASDGLGDAAADLGGTAGADEAVPAPDPAPHPVQPSLASLDTAGGDDPLLPAGDPLEQLRGGVDRPDAPPAPAPGGDGLFGAATAAEAAASDELDPAEMARQLANLSPKAAKAVARAARATSAAEREEALAQVEAEADGIDRGMLLRFLGSVED